MNTQKQPKQDRTLWLNLALIAAFFALISLGIYLVRDKLLYNANEMGMNLAQSYSREEESRVSIYSMFLTVCGLYTNTAMQEEMSPEELQSCLAEYSDYMAQVLGFNIIDPYAVIDGHIVAAIPWEGDDNYDYSQKEWYTRALEADGAIVFTDVYVDAITGRKLVTLSMKLEGDGNVLAFDIFMDNFHTLKNKTELPKGSCYFLYDGSGELIYLTGAYDLQDPEVQAYADRLLQAVQSGESAGHTATILGLDGNEEGIYYHELQNGWTSIVTFSIREILYGADNAIMYLLVGIFFFLLIAVIFSMFREYAEKRKVKYISDTLQILGDTYYAIYRVDLNQETYDTVKTSPDMEQKLSRSGPYAELLEAVGGVVEGDTKEELKKNFRLDNIRHLIGAGIYEFGGDYQRRFEKQSKWVAIKIVYNRALGLNEAILCFREIDAEKKKELRQHELLEQALDNARRAAQKKSMFFSNMSHDMRTPLNAITGLAHLAQEHRDDPEKVGEYLDKIERSSRQMTALVNDVLDMSRIEQGLNHSLDCRPMDLPQCVRECAELFREQAEHEGKTFDVSIDVQDPMVSADPVRLNQILSNLLSNAFKYSNEGARIGLRLRQIARQEHRGQYRITVEDTGVGMSPSFLDKLFEPFARETVFAPTRATGTGLGMSIVKALVQQMSGEITVHSELGKGTRFVVSIPLSVLNEREPQKELVTQVEPFSMEGKRILIAEDNELNMEIATEFLSLMGMETLQSWNGREALERFQASKVGEIDAILMDMQMPEMDGCAACRAIRALPRPDAKTVPIIAVTANAFAEDVAKTAEAGMDAHVSKPIDFKQLSEILKKLSDRRS